MKKGISIWSFGNKSLKEAFLLAKAAGFDGVEVALDEQGEINLNSTEEELLKIKALAKECGIELYSVATGLYWKYSLTSDDAAQREKAKSIVKKQLETAAVLGCDTILVVPGAVSVSFAPELGVVDYETAYNRSLEAFKELAPVAEKLKVNIALENVWNNFLLSPLEFRDFIDKIGSHYVGSYFDVGNVVYSGYPEQWIKILGKRIKKVHFKDYRRAVGSLDGFVDLLAGDVDYPAVMEAFKQIGYDGWATAEMIPPYKHHSEAIIFNTSYSMDKILGK
ncbi:MAG TPA: sugar phosphate isomerase/epimerase family protein [Clostridia bacterium]